MKATKLIVITVIILYLTSLYTPWLKITFLGTYQITLIGIYSTINQNKDLILNTTQTNKDKVTIPINITYITISLITYPIALATAITSIKYRRHAIISGLTGLTSGITWLIGIETIKNNLIQGATNPLTKIIATTIANTINPAIGSYITITAAITTLIYYVLTPPSKDIYPQINTI